jgi:hypothetical protein
MNATHKFLSCVSRGLKRRNYSVYHRDRILNILKKKYGESHFLDPFFKHEEDEWEFDTFHDTQGDKNLEVMDQMKIAPEESVEDRILRWQRYYESREVFSDDEMETISSIDEKGDYGRTKLHLAVLSDDADKILQLLKENADPKMKDNSGYTPHKLALLEECDLALAALEKFGVFK